MITLNEITNVYEKDGLQYDRLSTILQAVGIIDPQWYTEFGATRGTYVHQACSLFDQGTLDWSSLDHRIEGYVLAWAQFRKDSASRFKNLFIEQRLYLDQDGVAGTTDRIELEGKRLAILDIKTGDSDFAGVQTAGYESMLPSLTPGEKSIESFPSYTPNRYAVKLNEKGTYKLKPLDKASDKTIWRSAVNVYRFNHPIRRIK